MFKDLYGYCQTLTPKISRVSILNKVLELTGKKQVRAVKQSLDVSVCRGMFLSASNEHHKIVQQLGCDIIVLARGQKYCWERFVYVKELMHVFDDDLETLKSPSDLETLLTEFEMASVPPSSCMKSEYNGFWMALACLCPEKSRLEFKQQRDNGHIDDYSIALQLKIPEQYVPRLFEPRYEVFLRSLK
jgi:hypothetical protein